LVNVNYTAVADQLQLNEAAEPFNFIWVAVSTKGTVVKIDTNTGQVLGEYRSAPAGMGTDPSRTTVDNNGSAWITNRAEWGFVSADTIAAGVPPVDRYMGSVTHFGLAENGQCVDRNGNGVIDTSTGLGDVKAWPNTGGADTLGGVSTAEDECTLQYVRVNSNGARHVAVDAANNVWVSGIGGRFFDLIDSTTGAITRQEPSVGYGGYGGLIDGNGVIWSTGSGHLLRWDTALPLSGPNGDPGGPDIGPPAGGTWAGQGFASEYGLCINPNNGEVWNTDLGSGLITRYAPDGAFIGQYDQGKVNAQGCVVDSNGHVWVAHSLWQSTVGHLDEDGALLGNVTVGSGPTGVAVDGNGKVWATNYNSRTVSRIDPALNSGVGAVDFTTEDLGGNLYNYSDMTGSTLSAPRDSGTWTVVHDTDDDPAKLKISWTADTPAGSALGVKIACSSDGSTFGAESSVVNGASNDVSDCRYVKVIASFTRATTGESPVLFDLTIESNEPPDCSTAYADPTLLWSPNHGFVPISILGVTDPDGDTLTITIDSIWQDEAVNAKGSGNTAPDGRGVGTNTAEVRAERVGGGNGRVYHIGFTADDGNGGVCTGDVQVGVPHDKGKGATPVDDGAFYNSTLMP
jgi:streptogramin lyase